jgi:hypothetical protein
MTYTADFLISKRREKWEELHSIEYDKQFREAVANELISNRSLLEEVKRYPEKLIELMFIVVDKNQKTLPFFLNAVQKDFIGRLNQAIEDFEAGKITEISMLVLKGRQQGFTTVITAYQLSCSILNRNFQGFTLADKSDNSEAIFQNKAKYPYSQLPEILKPTEKFNNRKQLLFEKINSSWAVDTATKDVGRSRTVNFFHGSECAFWKDGIAFIQAALGEAFTKNCIKIYESTANGYNDYQVMWDSGVHINCFYEWWHTPEYRLEFPSEEARTQFRAFIFHGDKGAWINDRLTWLCQVQGLEDEQLYWYYKKWEGYIDKDLIKQEYPCSPQEAFLLSGKTVFDTERLLARLQTIKKPIKRGYFLYDYDGLQITNIRWHTDRNGPIKIYGLPNTPEFTKYCIGGDTAGDGSDNYTAHVLDAKTGIEVAALEHKYDADQYARQIFCLGKYYGDALIGIEANFDSYPIMELQRLGYTNQYIRTKVDEYTGKTEKRYGFRTTTLTRPTIISRLIQIVREDVESINDENTLKELLTIIRNEKGRIEAPEGGHDDHMMGLAIAHHIREQVVFVQEPINVPSQHHFTIQDKIEVEYDYGEQIVVI